MKIEIWKPCAGFEWNYEISNMGRLRTLGKTKNYSFPRMLHPAINGDGYLGTNIVRADGKKTSVQIHRLVAATFIENPENKPIVNHIDGDKTNNAASNLEWCTIRENNLHAYRIGLCPKGEEKANHKLTREAVEFIRQHYKPHSREFGSRALGRKFGVSNVTIIKAARNEHWR